MESLKPILLDMLEQNKLTCSFAFEKVTIENSSWRLNQKTASAGFIFRHIGETMNLFGFFFGIPSEAPNTTLGREDTGETYELTESKILIEKGYLMLENLINTTPEDDWNTKVETPFFGSVSKMRLFSHVLFHNAHHAGQLALPFSRGA